MGFLAERIIDKFPEQKIVLKINGMFNGEFGS
jgi:hypothetical protein